MKKLEHYEKLSKIKLSFNPLKMFMEKPAITFFITVPISIIYLFFNTRAYISVENHFLMGDPFLSLPHLLFFLILICRIRKFEDRMPDFLKRLPDKLGWITLTQAIEHGRIKPGLLTYEIKKVSCDYRMGDDNHKCVTEN